MEQEGLSVDSQTLWDVIDRLAMIAKDVPEAIFAHVLAAGVAGADETRWRLLVGGEEDAD